jgi:hypothetical protein
LESLDRAKGQATMTHRLAAYGAQAAVVSGVLSVVGTVVLLLFFALESPTVIASANSNLWTPLGRTNDLLVGLSALTAIPLAALLRERWHVGATGASGASGETRATEATGATVAYAVGLVAMLGVGAFGVSSFANLISLTSLGALGTGSLAGLGLWQIIVSLRSDEPALRGRLRQVGIVSGIGFVLELVAFLAIGGSGGIADPQAALRQPLFVAIAGVGLLASFIGYPIWSILLGRRLGRRSSTVP